MSNFSGEPRVLVVAASLRFMGGQAIMAQQLVADLRSSGLTAGFLPVDPPSVWPLSLVENVKYLRTVVRSISYIFSLVREVPHHDVIHVFAASYSSFLISPVPALCIGRLFGKQVVLNYHSGEAADHLQRCGRLTKWFMRLANCVLVQSPYLASVFRRYGFQAIVIPNHLDTRLMRFRKRDALVPFILVPRALEPLYNIPCALRAFQIVQRRYPAARMSILGDGSQRKELDRHARELNLTGVTFTGRVERSQIAKIYDQHDLLLNTSSIDNMPVSLLEGFAAGLPIVTTNPGGIPDIIVDRLTGHLVPVNDHEEAASRILELIADQGQVSRLSAAGAKEARRYTWETVGPLWMAFYRTVAGKSSPASRSESHTTCGFTEAGDVL